VPRGRGFAHIGEMLARLLSADVQGRPDDGMRATITTIAVGLGLSSLTGKQAFAIGSAIASKCVHQAHALAAVLNKVVTSHGTLQHASFMAILEVMLAHKTIQPRGSVVMNRLRSSISPVASSDVALQSDAADNVSGFSSVVRLGAHGPVSLCTRWLWRPKAFFCALPVSCGGTLQVPADALAIKVVDSTLAEPVAAATALAATALCLALHASGDVGSESEVPGFAQGRFAAVHFAISCSVASKHGSWGCEIPQLPWKFWSPHWPYGSLRTCAGPRRSEQRS
jgi:hypothetical protein